EDGIRAFHVTGVQTCALPISAAITLPLGLTQGKEYAELEWPIDLAVVVVWVVFAVNFFWTLAKRNEKNIYVAIWFYIASIVTVRSEERRVGKEGEGWSGRGGK